MIVCVVIIIETSVYLFSYYFAVYLVFLFNSSSTFLQNKKNKIVLDEETGIDILGNAVESCAPLSINPQLYGNLHNQGHHLLAYIHDPDGRHLVGLIKFYIIQ